VRPLSPPTPRVPAPNGLSRHASRTTPATRAPARMSAAVMSSSRTAAPVRCVICPFLHVGHCRAAGCSWFRPPRRRARRRRRTLCRPSKAAAPSRRACRPSPAAEVLARDDVKANLPKRAADRTGVVHGFAKLLAVGNVSVAVVVNDESDAPLRVGRTEGADERQPCDCNDVMKSHLPLSQCPARPPSNMMEVQGPRQGSHSEKFLNEINARIRPQVSHLWALSI